MVRLILPKLDTSPDLFQVFALAASIVAMPATLVDLGLAESVVRKVAPLLPSDQMRDHLLRLGEASAMWVFPMAGLTLQSVDVSWVDRKYFPAIVSSSARWEDCLKWLADGIALVGDSRANFIRSFEAVKCVLDQSSDIVDILRFVFKLLVSSPPPGAGLAVALMSDSSGALASAACAGLVASTNEIEISEAVIQLSSFPMRPNVALWFEHLFDALRSKNCREALYRITMGPTLTNLVLQLFSPSCRKGALACITKVLLGFQTNPSPFHASLTALHHVVKYLQAEGESKPSMSGNIDITALWSSHHLLTKLTEPPKFDSLAPFFDSLPPSDLLEDLCVLLYDQMTLHSGFFEAYSPIMTTIRPMIPASYVPDLVLIQSQSWTNQPSAASAKRFKSSPVYQSPVVSVKREPGTAVGLVNLGNTCYANSLLQALFYARSFRKDIYGNVNGKVCKELARVFANLDLGSWQSYAPRSLFNSLPERYQRGDQNDASEFAKHLFDAIDREQKEPLTWQGRSSSAVTCLKCGLESNRIEAFSDISLPLQAGNSIVSVDSMIADAFKENQSFLTGDNRYRCEKCDDLVDASLSVHIVEAPRHLMLHCLRFSYEHESKKIMTPIDFENRLGLPVGENEETISYSLFAVINHSGVSMHHGHYYCYACDESDVWHLLNDSVVRRATFQQVKDSGKLFPTDCAYILCYRRTDEADQVGLVPDAMKSFVL